MANGCIDPAPNWWQNLTPQPLVIDFPTLQGVLTADFYAEIRESNSTAPSTVIDVDDGWAVDIHIEATSPILSVLCGFWCVSVCLDNMCGGNDYRFPRDSTTPPGYCCVLIPLNPCSGVYDTTICVPGGIVKEDECGGPFEATAIITLLSACRRAGKQNGDPNDPGTWVPAGAAGAVDLPLLTFYDDTGGLGE